MRTCSVEGCYEKHRGNGFCRRHYTEMIVHGKILERSKNDPNEFIIDNDICWVILYDNKCIEVARAKFFTIYYEQILDSKLKWHLDGYGYVVSSWYDKNDKKQSITLHELIIQLSNQEVPSGNEIDHKDGNKLNCLDDNLRICEHFENSRNRRKHKNNTSGEKAVYWNKRAKKYHAQITFNYKRIHLGYFLIKEDAARAYNAAAIKYFGEFAVLNNV